MHEYVYMAYMAVLTTIVGVLCFFLCALACVTRRKLQTPGNAEEHKRQETPTINLGVCGLS